jgi:flagellin-like protein
MKWEKNRSKGLSPVIATIILSAVVISVGGAIWSFAQGASTVIANNYVNETLTLMNEIIERFAVEHVSNTSDGKFLHVWVYNYGDVDIIVDIYANATDGATYTYKSSLYGPISSGHVEKIIVSYESAPLEKGDSIVIKVHSRRQNNAYYKYYVS